MHDRDQFRIDCVGVFDTVGALGIPLAALWRANRERYEFHDVELSSIVKVSLHALAIDEHREPFQAAVWRKPKFKYYSTITEQVWFAGAHADVGGGYENQEVRIRDGRKALDDVPLDWMLKRVLHYFPKFPAKPGSWSAPSSDWVIAPQHESRSGIYRLLPFALRSIANYPVPLSRLREVNVCRDRHANVVGESVHMSAIERLGQPVAVGNKNGVYVPGNLLAVLKQIEMTYGGRVKPATEVRVTNWSGEAFDTKKLRDRKAVAVAVHAALKRIENAPGSARVPN
jgi:hypothetical protein